MVNREPICAHFQHAHAHANAVGIAEGKTIATTDTVQNGADPRGGHLIHHRRATKILNACAFKVAEIPDVVDMLEGIHLAPGHISFIDNGIPGQ